MRRAAIVIGVLSLLATNGFAEDRVRPYASLEAGKSWTNLDSGGFNSVGSFANTNDDTDSSIMVGARAGLRINRFRSDINFNYRESFRFKTDSFAPPAPSFFYKSKVKLSDAMVSAYYDILSFKKVNVFAGAGLGASFVNIKTDDTVVFGEGSDTKFAWKAEAGVEFPLSGNLSGYLNYRYADLGKAKIPLTVPVANTPAGTFEADLTANELAMGLLYLF